MLFGISVKSDVPDFVTEAGLKLVLTPVGTPVAESETTPLNPPDAVTVTTAYPLKPCSSDPELGETEMLKFPATAAVTVSVTVAVCVIPPPVPVTVIV